MPETNQDTLNLTPFWQWETAAGTADAGSVGIPFDSIHPLRELPDTIFRQSLVQGHRLPVRHDDVLPRTDTAAPVWVFVILILLIGLTGVYMRQRKITLAVLFKSALSQRAMDRMIRDCNLNRNALQLPMGLLVVAPLCLIIHTLAFSDNGILGFWALLGGGILLYILRNRLLRLLGNAFDNRQGISLYITSNYIYNLIEGIVVTTLTLPFFYLPGGREPLLYCIAVFLAFAFGWRFARGVKIFFTYQNSSRFFLFYYLCIVESIPVLAIIKWFLVR
jgi:hypothetical protein